MSTAPLLDCGHPDTTPDVAHPVHEPGCPGDGCDCGHVCASCCEQCQNNYDIARLPDRIRSKIQSDSSDDCWLWTGAISGRTGYGGIKYLGRQLGAHRVVYELLAGDIAEGLELDHLCRNRACVNPAHLEPVLHRINVFRGASPSAVNARATHCSRGHAFSPENTYVRPDGARDCRECIRIRRRIRASSPDCNPSPQETTG